MAIKLDFASIDFEKVEKGGGDYPQIPEGDYSALVTTTEEGTSKAGQPMVTVTFTIDDGEYTGRQLRDYYPANLGDKWVRFLLAIGYTKDDLQKLAAENDGNLEVSPEAWWAGTAVQLHIKPNDYTDGEGKPRKGNKISRISPPSDSNADDIAF